MNEPKEMQEEFFPEFSATPKRAERFPLVSRTHKPILFSTNTEQLLMIGILSILALCGVFFLGVIRGKALQGQPITEIPAKRAAIAENKGVAPIAPAQTIARSTTPSAPTVSGTPVSVPTRVTPAPPAGPAAAVKPYTIGLVTHRKKEPAEAEMNALRAQGFYSFIKSDRDYYQVCVGQYASRDEAKRDLALFKGRYKDPYLRRR